MSHLYKWDITARYDAPGLRRLYARTRKLLKTTRRRRAPAGTARRRPDVLRKALDLEALATTQAALLDAAWRCLKPGGLLVFSSCSALTADAEASFAAFLQRTADAHLVEVAAAELGFVDSESVVDGAVRLWPWHVPSDVGGCDAHYAARVRKGVPGNVL